MSMMIACSFDGASNMRSDDVGLQGRLKAINEFIVYIWCLTHNLNLSVERERGMLNVSSKPIWLAQGCA